MSNSTIYNIAIPVPLPGTFEYASPLPLKPGIRVSVTFARRRLTGVVISLCDDPVTPAAKLKPIDAILDAEPVFDQALLNLLIWASNYYFHPIGEVFSAALPSKIKHGGALEAATERLTLTELGIQMAKVGNLPRAPKQAQLLTRLQSSEPMSRADLTQAGYSAAVIRGLIQKNWACWRSVKDVPANDAPHHFKAAISLTEAQRQAIAAVELDQPMTYLLYGVTGSGKTEVYLRLIDQVLRTGKQALILVPEIALTPQTVDRFQDRFDCRVGALHSGMTAAERNRQWQAARSGGTKIIIGTRSAIFTPMASIGIIIVDEEHDTSYKQQDGFHYSARDLATVRAANEGIPVVLGSATPSLESIANAEAGKYQLLKLLDRANGAKRERYQMLPMPPNQSDPLPNQALFTEIRETLERGEQVLVMRNRRGYAPVLFCTECRWIAECQACDARLTVHRQQTGLKCHHCGASHPIPTHCPNCSHVTLTPVGDGTQRLETTFQTAFPNFPIVRIDSDNIKDRLSLDRALAKLQGGEPCILIGTQLIAKGHHFPLVTLAVVLDIDQGFLSADFKAVERTAQLIIQTGGRSGRDELAGKVYLSSRMPDLPGLNALIDQDYLTYAKQMLADRSRYELPPFAHHGLIRADAKTPGLADQLLQRVQRLVRAERQTEILGPTSPAMAKRAGWHRSQLLISASSRQARHKVLQQLQVALTQAAPRTIRWSIDVDPADFF